MAVGTCETETPITEEMTCDGQHWGNIVWFLKYPVGLMDGSSSQVVWISFSIPLLSQNLFLLSGSSHWEHYCVVSTVSQQRQSDLKSEGVVDPVTRNSRFHSTLILLLFPKQATFQHIFCAKFTTPATPQP